ncbi:MAG TPA: DUF2085 domain-containing protein [Thermoanaerobaculia bacterium]|nr:DUF2085 domain-containing protein [Thermoanaerobaculia bacterium]
MRRDTRIVLGVAAPIPALILLASAFCSWAIAHGASMQWRLLFRVLCHGIVSRCLTLFGVPMPICARCTAIYAGLLIGLLAFWFLPAITEKAARFFAFAALVPMGIDGLTQLFGWRESTNELRIATGILAGFAFGFWVLCAVERQGEDTAALLDAPGGVRYASETPTSSPHETSHGGGRR